MSIVSFPARPSPLLKLIEQQQWEELACALSAGAPATGTGLQGRTLLEEFLLTVHRSSALEVEPGMGAAELAQKLRTAQIQRRILATLAGIALELDPGRPTPLTLATMMGRVDFVETLLRAGHDPNALGQGETPATAIARRRMPGRLNIIEMREVSELAPELRFIAQSQCLEQLIKAGLDIDLPCSQGASAVQLACLAKDNQALMFFLVNGANPEGAPALEDGKVIYQLAPLEVAVVTYNPFAVHALLQAGANFERSPQLAKALQHLSHPSMVELAGGMGNVEVLKEFSTALGGVNHPLMERAWHFAALMDRADNVKWMIEQGFDLSGKAGLWGLQAAAENAREGVLRILQEAGMDFTRPGEGGLNSWELLGASNPALSQRLGGPVNINVVALRPRGSHG